MGELLLFKNNKNSNLYQVLNDSVIDCTNSENNKRMVLYSRYYEAGNSVDDTTLFCREYKEFHEKFTKIPDWEYKLMPEYYSKHLRHFGYVYGDYSVKCGICNKLFSGDKRAYCCKNCVEIFFESKI